MVHSILALGLLLTPALALADSVAVLPVKAGSGITEPIAKGYDAHLRKTVAGHATVLPLSATMKAAGAAGVSGACTSGECGKKLAEAAGARFVLSPSITNSDEIYQVKLSLYDAAHDKWTSANGTCELCAANEVDGTIASAVGGLAGSFSKAAPKPKPKPKPKKAEGMVKLEVNSTPAGATVVLNGKQAGETPLKTTVKAGQHEIKLSKDGFKEVTRKLSALDRPVALSVNLEALPPPVAVAPPIATPPPAAAPLTPAVTDTSGGGEVSTAAWGLSIGGVALVGVGVWMTALDGEVTCSDGRGRTECPNVYNTKWIGAAGIGVGAALLATGITLLVLDDGDEGAAPTTAGFIPTPDGGAFSLSGSF